MVEQIGQFITVDIRLSKEILARDAGGTVHG